VSLKLVGYTHPIAFAANDDQLVGLNVDCAELVKSGLMEESDRLDRNLANWTIFGQVKCWIDWPSKHNLLYYTRMCVGHFMLVATIVFPCQIPISPCLWLTLPMIKCHGHTGQQIWTLSRITSQRPSRQVASSWRSHVVSWMLSEHQSYIGCCPLFIFCPSNFLTRKKTRSSFIDEVISGIEYVIEYHSFNSSFCLTSRCSVKLNTWRGSLPQELEITVKSRPTSTPHKLMLHLIYWWMFILLHRPFFHRKVRQIASADREIDHVKVRILSLVFLYIHEREL